MITNAPPAIRKPVLPSAAKIGKPVTFGFIGRITEEKGIFDLAEAIGRMPVGSARLVIGGRVEEADKVRISARARGVEVIYLGFVAPELFFGQVDLTVVPSRLEDCCPMVVGESLAWGRPVLGSRMGGIPELLSDERSGWLFDHGDVSALSALMTLVAAHPEEILRRTTALLSARHRSFDDQVEDYAQVFRSVTV